MAALGLQWTLTYPLNCRQSRLYYYIKSVEFYFSRAMKLVADTLILLRLGFAFYYSQSRVALTPGRDPYP